MGGDNQWPSWLSLNSSLSTNTRHGLKYRQSKNCKIFVKTAFHSCVNDATELRTLCEGNASNFLPLAVRLLGDLKIAPCDHLRVRLLITWWKQSMSFQNWKWMAVDTYRPAGLNSSAAACSCNKQFWEISRPTVAAGVARRGGQLRSSNLLLPPQFQHIFVIVRTE